MKCFLKDIKRIDEALCDYILVFDVVFGRLLKFRLAVSRPLDVRTNKGDLWQE